MMPPMQLAVLHPMLLPPPAVRLLLPAARCSHQVPKPLRPLLLARELLLQLPLHPRQLADPLPLPLFPQPQEQLVQQAQAQNVQ